MNESGQYPDGLSSVLEIRSRIADASCVASRYGVCDALVLSGLGDAVIAIDGEGRITHWGPGAERMYGIQASEAIGLPLEDAYSYKWLDPEDERAGLQALDERGYWCGESIHVKRNGDRVHVESSVSILKDQDGNRTGLLAVIRDVTERSRAQAAADSAHRRLELVLATIPCGVIMLEAPDGRLSYVNERAIDLYGVDPTGLQIGEHPTLGLLRPDGSLCPAEELPASRALQRGEEVRYEELVIRQPSGRQVVVEASASPLYGSHGRINAAVAVFHDITEHKRLDSELRALTERLALDNLVLNTIMQNTQAHLAYLDSEFRFLRVNSTYCEGCGYTEEQLLGRGHFDLFPHEENESIFRRVRDTGEPFSVRAKPFEFPEQPWRATTYWDWALVPVKNPDGHIQGLVLSLMDVTERERTRMALSEAVERLTAAVRERDTELEERTDELAAALTEELDALDALHSSESRAAQLLDRLPCIQWTTDQQLVVTSMRGAGLESFNLDPDNILGTRAGMWFDTAMRRKVVRAHRRALAGKNSENEFGAAGRAYQTYVEPLRDALGDITGVIGLAFDVTARKDYEEELKALSRKVVETQESERRFIARELHDQVGQYLTALKVQVTRLSTSREDIVEDASRQANEILDELIAQMRSLSLEFRPSMLDDFGLLSALMWHFNKYSKMTGVQVQFIHSGLTPDIPSDTATAAYRIVQEALTNVARHSGAKEATVSATCDDKGLYVAVQDHGHGFDMSARSPATSLGLSGMRDRARMLGGELQITSTPGVGTLIRAKFPVDLPGRYSKRTGEG